MMAAAGVGCDAPLSRSRGRCRRFAVIAKAMRVLLVSIVTSFMLAACAKKPQQESVASDTNPPAATAPAAEESPATPSSTAARTGTIADLISTEWKLQSFDAAAPVGDKVAITLSVSGERISGQGGCNRYMGSIKDGAAPGELTVGPIALTKMACSAEVDAAEMRYAGALQQAKAFRLEDDKLLIEYRDGQATRTLTYVRA
jgi:heat shock protein HslJ